MALVPLPIPTSCSYTSMMCPYPKNNNTENLKKKNLLGNIFLTMFNGSLQGCLRVSTTMWVSNQSSVASCVVLPKVDFEIFYWSAVEKGKYNTSVSRI